MGWPAAKRDIEENTVTADEYDSSVSNRHELVAHWRDKTTRSARRAATCPILSRQKSYSRWRSHTRIVKGRKQHERTASLSQRKCWVVYWLCCFGRVRFGTVKFWVSWVTALDQVYHVDRVQVTISTKVKENDDFMCNLIWLLRGTLRNW